jgi:hypothetical protein
VPRANLPLAKRAINSRAGSRRRPRAVDTGVFGWHKRRARDHRLSALAASSHAVPPAVDQPARRWLVSHPRHRFEIVNQIT